MRQLPFWWWMNRLWSDQQATIVRETIKVPIKGEMSVLLPLPSWSYQRLWIRGRMKRLPSSFTGPPSHLLTARQGKIWEEARSTIIPHFISESLPPMAVCKWWRWSVEIGYESDSLSTHFVPNYYKFFPGRKPLRLRKFAYIQWECSIGGFQDCMTTPWKNLIRGKGIFFPFP